MVVGHPEHALDAVLIAHTDLNVSLAGESRILISRSTFGEDAFDCIKRLVACIFPKLVHRIDDSTVQMPPETVGTTVIGR